MSTQLQELTHAEVIPEPLSLISRPEIPREVGQAPTGVKEWARLQLGIGAAACELSAALQMTANASSEFQQAVLAHTGTLTIEQLTELEHALGGIVRSLTGQAEDFQPTQEAAILADIIPLSPPAEPTNETSLVAGKDSQTNSDATAEVLTTAQQKLVEDNIGLVRYCARKYYSSTMTADDLEQEGYVGLVQAASRFQPERGVAFSTLAAKYITGNIARAIRDRGKMVRGPREDQARAKSIGIARQAILSTGEEVTDEAVMKLSGLKAHDLVEQRRVDRYRVSISGMEVLVRTKDGEGDPNDFLNDPYHGTEVAENVVNKIAVNEAVDNLEDERSKDIIRMRYGLAPYDSPWKQTDIAKRLGISQMQVSRLQIRALARLKKVIEA